MTSIQAFVLINYVRLSRLFSPHQDTLDVARERANTESMAAKFKSLAPAQCQPVATSSVVGEWLMPEAYVDGRVVLYLHGGSYNAGSAHALRALATNTGYAAKARVLNLDYRLAPEHPFPAALQDAASAYAWLLGQGQLPGNLLLAGDSAGGGLVLCLLLKLRDQGQPLPAAAVCYSPWTDLALSGESYWKNAHSDVMIDFPSLEQSATLYLGNTDPLTPYASPLYGDLRGLPPVLIQVGSDEILLSDAQSFAEKARAAGVDLTLEVWPGMQHEWQVAAKILPEGKHAIEHVGRFVEAHL